MKINAFFAHRLKAPLYNHVWSWGAIDDANRRVFLRNDRSQIDEYDDGKRWTVLYDPRWNPSAGHSERLRHIEAIRNGYKGFAVVVDFNEKGKIASFDDNTLLRLGRIVEEAGLTYAEVKGECRVDDIIAGGAISSPARDIEDAFTTPLLTATERRAMVEARIGQGLFRGMVLRNWDYKCSVTGITTTEAIRASHIKPWKACNNEERLDPHNGLPLIATLDAIFDAGLISFENDGRAIVSRQLCVADAKALSLRGMRLSKKPSKATANYLQFHREAVFRRD